MRTETRTNYIVEEAPDISETTELTDQTFDTEIVSISEEQPRSTANVEEVPSTKVKKVKVIKKVKKPVKKPCSKELTVDEVVKPEETNEMDHISKFFV